MKVFSNLKKTAVGGLLFLASGQVFSAATDLNVKSINVPAYNLISDTLTGMSSSVSGKRNDFVMHLICDLARGDKNQQDVNAVLSQNNVNLQSIPAQGSISSLLINGDKRDQAATCAAYMATTFFQPADNSIIFDTKKNKDGKEESVLNQARFTNEVRTKMSLAQATANLYAVIASNMVNDSNLTFADYQQNVAKTVYEYAPEYLRLAQVLYTNDRAIYTPVSITKTSMNVVDNTGRELTFGPQEMVLKTRGVIWLGEGKILGKEYFSPVRIIAFSPAKAPATPKKPKTRRR